MCPDNSPAKEADQRNIHQALIHTLLQSSDAVLVADQADRILFFNAGAERLWGIQADQAVGSDLRLLLPQKSGTHCPSGVCVNALAASDSTQRQMPIEHTNGLLTDTQVSITACPMPGQTLYTLVFRTWPGADGAAAQEPSDTSLQSFGRAPVASPSLPSTHEQLTHALDLLLDIAHTKTAEELQSRLLLAITQGKPVQEIMTMICLEIERLSPGTATMVLLNDEQSRLIALGAPSLPLPLLMAYDGQTANLGNDACVEAIRQGAPLFIPRLDTDPRCAAIRGHAMAAGLHTCWINPIINSNGTVLGALALFSHHAGSSPSPSQHSLVGTCLPLCLLALEREKTREHIHQLTFYDTLTGLPNRDMLRAHVNQSLRDNRHSQAPLALMLIKLRRLMHSAHPHDGITADTIRSELAKRIRRAARHSDMLGQLSHDEFLVALPRCSRQQAQMAAERFVNELKKPFAVGPMQSLHASVCIGVSSFPEDGQDFDSLLRHADVAMLHAEAEGRNAFRIFNKEMNEAAQERERLEHDLRQALMNNTITLHYQPQVRSTPDQSLLGVEALMRWPHPELGMIPPDRFIALAEECDLIDALAHWTIHHACWQLANWRMRGIPVPRISINLSSINFRDANLPCFIASELARHQLQPCDLTLEVTESIMLQPDPDVAATINALHDLGLMLSLDDFGTGFSSLSYLHRLPINELKLDKSFVLDIEHSSNARALTRSVLLLGESLGLNVIAEGVETPPQRQFLAEQGCDALQGYLIARPMPAADLEAWLAA